MHLKLKLWTLKLITGHCSFNSYKDTSQLFLAMFPDSQITRQFACGERSAVYRCIFGLADYFKKLLQDVLVDFLLHCLMKA